MHTAIGALAPIACSMLHLLEYCMSEVIPFNATHARAMAGSVASQHTCETTCAAYTHNSRAVEQVLVNGRLADASLRRHSAYVPQEDAFVPTLSAWETLEVRVQYEAA